MLASTLLLLLLSSTCAVKKLKVLDFSADNDHEPDINGEFTSATLNAGPLPESFTICSAFMTNNWTTEFSSSRMFLLLDDAELQWGRIYLYAASSFTQYEATLGPVQILGQTETVFFPLRWTSACLSLNSVGTKVTLVVDGQLLGEKVYRREDWNGPANLSLLLGLNPLGPIELTGRVSELNIFGSSLSPEKMMVLTTAGGEGCGEPGDLINWEEAEWTLHSQAKVIEVDREWEGP